VVTVRRAIGLPWAEKPRVRKTNGVKQGQAYFLDDSYRQMSSFDGITLPGVSQIELVANSKRDKPKNSRRRGV